MDTFTIKTRTAASNTAVSVVDIAGLLDLKTIADFEDTLRGLFQKKQFKIVLNLERLTYISIAGIAALLGGIKETRKNRGDIKIAGENSEFSKVVELLELENVFPFFKNEEAAVRDF